MANNINPFIDDLINYCSGGLIRNNEKEEVCRLPSDSMKILYCYMKQ